MRQSLVLLCSLVSVSAVAQTQRSPPSPSPESEKSGETQRNAQHASAEDIDALRKLHHTNQMEVQMGRLAKENGGLKEVHSFGDLLVRDHSLADKQLVQLAQKQNFELLEPQPKTEAEKADAQSHVDLMKRLQTLKGPDFDKAFATAMVKGHQDAISLIESAMAKTQDSQTHAFMQKVLPLIREHHKVARSIEQRLHGPAPKS